jgi:arsenite-transporting ATPase
MSLAKAWDQFLDDNQSGTSCLGPLAGLEKQRAIYEAAVATLADARLTTLVLVSRPQRASLREAKRTSIELQQLGVTQQQLVINGSFTTDCPHDAMSQAMQERGRSALEQASDFITSLPTFLVPLKAINILGVAGLRKLSEYEGSDLTTVQKNDWQAPSMLRLSELVDELEKRGRGVIMTMGKGGVGKTTVAAAIAVSLAKRGHAVHLSTTDPAAHVAQTLDGQMERLTLSKIDPAAETAAYTATVMVEQSAHLDESARALLEEDLRSPCTEEIAVFRAFVREVAQGEKGFVVLDTAPTGHTLLLLDASEAYQRELERQTGTSQPEEVLRLLERLRDHHYTAMILVAVPEATPIHEAAALQEDLRRAQIEPFAWVINQSLLGCGTCDPLLMRREESEHRYLTEVAQIHAKRVAWLPWQVEEPVGVAALLSLSESKTS